jgi:ATP-dependent DNA helicase RecQ
MRDIHEVLKSTWGYDAFRPRQEEIVRAVLKGTDTLALLPTGGGKSLCFQVPALAMGRLCLVVSPLIALMKDQVERLKAAGIRAAAITSGMDHSEIDRTLESAAVGKTAFLYVSPERLATEIFLARLPRLPLGLIAVDEAHCISQWGYDFRPSYLRVAELRVHHPNVPVLALTASATAAVAKDIMERLQFRTPHMVRGSFARPELTLWISRGEDKMGRLSRIVKHVGGTGIVYLRERRGTVRIAQFLREQGVKAEAYHAGLDHAERDRIQRAWTSGEVRYVAATNAFGMGIDKSDVRCVVHLEPPPDMESYYQEAGRAGRDGNASFAFLLTQPSDAEKLREKFIASFPDITQVRRVYQAFADMHHIALGSGQFEEYDLDLRGIGQRTALPPVTVSNCIKALELDGSLSVSDGARTPSRVGMRTGAKNVYDLRVRNERLGPVLEALLRMHGGLFEEPAIIDEERISQQLKLSTNRVIALLRELERMNVIFYKQRSDRPTVTLLTPRRDAQLLMLDKQALDARKDRARQRMEAMVRFAFRSDECRERLLLRYFDEPTAQDCGRCDACRTRATKVVNGDAASAEATPRTTHQIEHLRWLLDAAGGPASALAEVQDKE